MGSKRQAEASSKQAAWMKLKGIARRTTRCVVCYHIIPIPVDNHLNGGCRGPRRKGARNKR